MKARKARQHENVRRNKTERIIKAARKLFLSKGYQNTTMRSICRASRLSNGTVYFYFKNKDAIYACVYEESFQYLIDMFSRAAGPEISPFTRIEILLKIYLKFFIEHREKWDMLDISYRRLNLPEYLVTRFDQMLLNAYSFFREAVQAYIDEKKLASRYDSIELAILLITSVDGLLYNYKQGFFEEILADTHLTLEKLVDRQIIIFKKALT